MMQVKLRDKEETLMNILWDKGDSMSSMEMVAALPQDIWGVNSDKNVHKVLRDLLKKDMLEVTGQVLSGTHYARLFKPTMSREAYMLRQLSGLKSNSLRRVAFGLTKMADVKAAETDEADENLIEELEEIIREVEQGDEE